MKLVDLYRGTEMMRNNLEIIVNRLLKTLSLGYSDFKWVLSEWYDYCIDTDDFYKDTFSESLAEKSRKEKQDNADL